MALDQNNQDATNAAQKIIEDAQQEQAVVDSLNQTVDAEDAQIGSLTTQVQSQNTTIQQQAAQIQDLTNKLNAALASGNNGLVADLLTQFNDCQKQTGWVLAGGSAGNTGQQGSLGDATWTVNPDGSVTVAIAPKGPYYDCFYYRKFAGTGSTLPMPTLKQGIVIYHCEFMLDKVNLPKSQAVEQDSSWYFPTHRLQAAGQIELAGSPLLADGSKLGTWRFYDATGQYNAAHPGTPEWASCEAVPGLSKVIAKMVPGQWTAVDILCLFDPIGGYVTYRGVQINGVYTPLNIQVKAKTFAINPNTFAHTSVQLDSNSKGDSYSGNFNHMRVTYL